MVIVAPAGTLTSLFAWQSRVLFKIPFILHVRSPEMPSLFETVGSPKFAPPDRASLNIIVLFEKFETPFALEIVKTRLNGTLTPALPPFRFVDWVTVRSGREVVIAKLEFGTKNIAKAKASIETPTKPVFNIFFIKLGITLLIMLLIKVK